nr:MAG TPA: hypothetical protein [Caudoviricetes sp.]
MQIKILKYPYACFDGDRQIKKQCSRTAAERRSKNANQNLEISLRLL